MWGICGDLVRQAYISLNVDDQGVIRLQVGQLLF